MAIKHLILFCLIFSGACLRQKRGMCTYKENGIKSGIVTIISILNKNNYGKTKYHVRVKGFINRVFILNKATHQECIIDNNLSVGSKVKGSHQEGGPCPDKYFFGIGKCANWHLHSMP
jgi:hypothetical protein